MATLKADLLILGAGSAGLSVAAGAAQMGAKVVLLEPGEMGGDCLNTGCVPSKALLAAAHMAHVGQEAAAFGVRYGAPEIDFAAVKDHVARVIATIAPHDSQERFEGFGVTVIRAPGRFVSDTEVEAGEIRITSRRIVIATGSHPAVPPIPGLDHVKFYTNETVFDLRTRPDHLLIIGGGPIGIEMAQAHRRLGSAVTVIEAARCLAGDDPELVQVVTDRLRAEGITLVENCAVASVSSSGDMIRIEAGQGQVFSGSHLLVATGRRANIAGLDLDKAGIESTDKGITVDAKLKTTNRRVYAIGDVIGQGQFTHLAGYHAGLVVRSAVLGLPAKVRHDHIPHVTYTDPELAHVGLTHAQAKDLHGDKVQLVEVSFGRNDRAVAQGQSTGRIKLVTYKGRPVGASLVGPQAGELIHLWSFAIANRVKLSKISGMVAPYPTLGEINKSAVGQYFSPKLFESSAVKSVVRLIQRLTP